MFLNLLPYARRLPEIGVQTKILKRILQNQHFGFAGPANKTNNNTQAHSHKGCFKMQPRSTMRWPLHKLLLPHYVTHEVICIQTAVLASAQVAPFRSEPTLPLTLSSLETTPLFGCYCIGLCFGEIVGSAKKWKRHSGSLLRLSQFAKGLMLCKKINL